MKGLTERIRLEEDEQVIRVLRKHWFILFAKVLGPFLLFILPFFVIPLARNNPTIEEVRALFEYVDVFIIFVTALWMLLMWVVMWTLWTDYYLDMWTITNRRIIAIDQRGLFNRHIASFRYERLQDIEIHINGLIATLLNFGTLEATTAGHDTGASDFRFTGTPRPREAKATILKAVDARINRKQSAASSESEPGDGV